MSRSTVDWKWGCQPFSCRCSQNVTQCQTRFGRHIFLRERHPFPTFLFGMYNLNFYHKLEVPESRSTFRQLCITLCLHHAHPFVAAAEKGRKSLSYAEKQRVWSRSCGLQDMLQCSDCALSCAMRLLQTMANQ